MSDFKQPSDIDISSEIGKEAKPVADDAQAKKIAADIEWILSHSNIPARYQNININPITEEQKKLLAKLKDNFASGLLKNVRDMLIMGKIGVGKTHTVIAYALQLIKKGGLHCRYTTEYNYIELLQIKYNDKDARNQLNALRTMPLLIIDEIGKHDLTEKQLQDFEELLAHRYNELTPTIMLTNLNTEQFKKHIGDRAADRLRDNNLILATLVGDSLRGGNHAK